MRRNFSLPAVQAARVLACMPHVVGHPMVRRRKLVGSRTRSRAPKRWRVDRWRAESTNGLPPGTARSRP